MSLRWEHEVRPSEGHESGAFRIGCERHVGRPPAARRVAPSLAPPTDAELVTGIVARRSGGTKQRAQSTAEVQRREFRILSLVGLSSLRCSRGRPPCCGAGDS